MNILSKLSLPATILIASIILGGFFYATELNKQRSIESQQQIEIETRKQKELKEQEDKAEAERLLDTCLYDAEVNYSNRWYRECKSRGELTQRCIYLQETTLADYLEENNLSLEGNPEVFDEYIKEKDGCSCRLPLDSADRINQSREDDKVLCFRKYPKK